jgi:polysaccharide biosynthesis protein PslG
MYERKLTSATLLVLFTLLSPVPLARALQESPARKTAEDAPALNSRQHDDGDARSDASPFGFACDNQTTYTLAGYCPQMAKAGLRWLRGFPTFNVIEPAPGRFEWATVDEFLTVAAQNKVRVSGLFFYNAPWIKPSDALPTGDLPAWSAYVRALVAHCKVRVRYWEVWNETPNFMGKGTPLDYARTVVAAYDAAKSVDPSCQIGLSIQSVNVNWLEQVLDAGAKGHFDFIAVHPYETLGVVESDGWDAQYMSIVPTLRKMLLAKDPGRAKVPIWFTEIGREAKGEEDSQGSALVKAFVMGIAQGVTRINWFEGKDGDSGPMGLLRADGTPRLAFTAMSTMTRLLGPAPQYLGWVSVNGKHNGFVFQGATSTVMAMWARPNAVDRVDFGSVVEFVDPRTGGATKADRCSLSGFPVFMSGVPEVLVRRAQANKSLPFPWDGDFSRAKGVSLTARKPNLELGLHQLQADASSAVVNVEGSEVRDCSQSAAQSFVVDPNFLSYTTRPITITALVRRKEGNENAGFNLTYESKTGWKNADGWYNVPENPNWHSKTWIIHDSQFVGKWGINFSFNSDSPMHSKYYLKSVVVANEEGAGGR